MWSHSAFFGGCNMNYVGIDVSKFKHDCFIATETGEIVRSSFSFANDRKGFSEFLDVLKALDPKATRICFESTGHYGNNLRSFIESTGYPFMELNPLLVSRFRKSATLRRTKTDRIDAKVIAQALMSTDFHPASPKSRSMESLKALTRHRFRLVRLRSNILVQLTAAMDVIFPEFKPFFKGIFSKTAFYMLDKYRLPEKMAKLGKLSYAGFKDASRGKISYVSFCHLIELAKNTIGNTNEFAETQIDTLVMLHKSFNAEISKTEVAIKDAVRHLNSPLASIKGVGDVTVATILAEFGDISRFPSPSKMLSFAGMEPDIIQSGKSNHIGKMVKHGSSYLRYALMNAAEMMIVHHQVMYDYYSKKRAEGKPHRVALTHVAKKLVRIIYKLETENIVFNPALLR